MDLFIQQISTLLTTSPGNLVYFLALAFSVMATLQIVIGISHTSPYPYTLRLILGVSLVLLAQVLLFFSSGLVWQKIAASDIFLPPLDRAIFTFSLLWVTWLWVAPKPNRAIDIITGLLSLGLVIFFFYCLTVWSAHDPTASFNNTSLDQIWLIFCLTIVVVGLFMLLLKRPEVWVTGLVFLILVLAGLTGHLLRVDPAGNYSASIRLALLCAFPLLPLISQRLFIFPAQPTSTEVSRPPGQDRRHYTADPRAVNTWLRLVHEIDPARTGSAMTRAIAQTMLADLCFLISPPTSSGEVVIHSGYDLIREEELPGAVLEQTKIQALANAVQRGRPLRLLCEGTVPADLTAVSEAIGLEKPGNLLMIPLIYSQKVWGGLLLLSPYSSRVWTLDDQTYLGGSTEIIIEVLQQAGSRSQQVSEIIRVQEELQSVQLQLEALQSENQNLNEVIQHMGQPAQPNADLEELLVLQKESQVIIARLQAENERLKTAALAMAVETQDNNQANNYETELRMALKEVAHLQNAVAEANLIIENLQKSSSAPHFAHSDANEVIASVAQEIRQPMSSIIGYTDLLLSESVGILGALQRKFLERVKASTERMRSQLDDLIQTVALESGILQIVPQAVDLGKVIDQAIVDTSSQMRERNITLRVDLPDELPQMQADQDALQQILIHLLQNASAVTPREGTINLRVHVQEDKPGEPCLFLQVTDHGGGIAKEDISRVFARRYRADNPLVQGVGDTGVGLSITKTLTEALGGHIWVESDPGQSSTFSVLLPIGPAEETIKPAV
jgi:signal transduction histidine kinase